MNANEYTEIRGIMAGDIASGYRDGGLVIVSVRLQGCAEEIFTLRTNAAVADVLQEELHRRNAGPDRDTPITLTEAASLYPLAYSSLAQAAREGRFVARQSGTTWITSRAAIEAAIKSGKLRPRNK